MVGRSSCRGRTGAGRVGYRSVGLISARRWAWEAVGSTTGAELDMYEAKLCNNRGSRGYKDEC